MYLILLRHGESQWNLENKFTGWTDVSLTSKGKEEAKFAANQIKDLNIHIDSFYTSILCRAKKTSSIVSKIIEFPPEKIIFDWRLNERHYGELQGLNKSETAKKYGEEQVRVWRRSYDISPPLLSIDDERHPKNFEQFKCIKSELPSGESLKNVVERINPFWKNFIKKETSKNSIFVAHSNSLRAIIKILENKTSKQIMEVEIPTGIPLVYKLDEKLNILNKRFLIDDDSLVKRQQNIINQGRVK